MASNKAVKLVINQEPFIKLTIKQAPKPPVRLLADHIDKYSQIYENKKARVFKKLVAHKYRLEYAQKLPTEKPLTVDVRFYRPIQKSISKIERQRRLTGQSWPTVKPDVDNYVKAILDALNGVAFKDDSQIVVLYARKIYSDNPRTEIEITEM